MYDYFCKINGIAVENVEKMFQNSSFHTILAARMRYINNYI